MTPIVTWSIVALIVICAFYVRRSQRAHLDRVRRSQDIRERFAKNRRVAVHLLHDGQLSPTSTTFATLYLVSSKLVRRSNSYGDFSAEIVRSLADTELRSDSPSLGQLKQEMESWTPDVREAWISFSNNIFYMVATSVWWMRALVFVDKVLPLSLFFTILIAVGRFFRARIDRSSTVPTIGFDVMRTSRQTQEWARVRLAA